MRVLLELQEMLTDRSVSVIVRETVIDLLLKNLMHMDGGIPRGWSWKFTSERGVFLHFFMILGIAKYCGILFIEFGRYCTMNTKNLKFSWK